MAGTGAGSLMTTLRMKEAVQTVGNAMDHARQVAMTSNREVVFRIYKVSNDMGEESWRTVEYGTVDVVINPDDAGYKDPTAADYEPPFNRAGPGDVAGGPGLPPLGNVFHVAFREPGGSREGDGDGHQWRDAELRELPVPAGWPLQLGASQKWTLTLVKEAEVSGGGLPANFATMQLEPATARVRFFRP
ncbi:hypothetical protein [Verrucomicrobium spinosum]|uniref:hypothetical protein n=1 Tax=Verrucomicrobium spinosum TaxID=2736 RepID=UPI0012E2DD42|nr:hypothetical protein [Verrucomicrobium spinosum]